MTPEQWQELKAYFAKLHSVIKDLWLDHQILRNFIVASGMPEEEFDEWLERSRQMPGNRQQVEQQFSASADMAQTLDLDGFFERLERQLRSTEKAGENEPSD